MPDALMTELTPMEHSQNIVSSCSFRVLGRTLPSSVPGKLPGSTAQDGSPRKKKALPFPGSAPVIIVISVYIVNWIAQKAA